MVPGDDKEIIAEFFHLGQVGPFKPDLYKDVLGHFFCYNGGFGEGEGHAIYIVPIPIK